MKTNDSQRYDVRAEEAKDGLLALQSEWFATIAPLHHHRREARRFEAKLTLISRRRDAILRDLDADDRVAVTTDNRLSLLLGTHGCQNAEAIFGGGLRKAGRKGIQ